MRKRWLAGFGAALTLILGFTFVSESLNTARQNQVKNAPLLALQYSPDSKQWRGANKPGTSNEPIPLPAAVEDPMANVDTFLQANQKVADDSINTLTREAESLRTRLRKVEAALGRWQGVAKALQQEANGAEARPVTVDAGAMATPADPPLLLPSQPSVPRTIADPEAPSVPPVVPNPTAPLPAPAEPFLQPVVVAPPPSSPAPPTPGELPPSSPSSEPPVLPGTPPPTLPPSL